jgi:dienelactone hydrolase
MLRVFLVGVIFLVGCVSKVEADPSELGPIAPPPTAEFDPAKQIVPLPNNLLLGPTTGKLALPAQCGETPAAAAIRTGILNTLDGFGTSKTVIQTTFSEPVDAASLMGHVFLLRMATGGAPLASPEPPVPINVTPGTTIRYGQDCMNPAPVNDILIIPTTPLDGSSTYAVALVQGIKNTSGSEFFPSVTWALVRQPSDPVQISGVPGSVVVTQNLTPFNPQDPKDLASIVGLDQLWKATAPTLRFLDAALPQVAPSVPPGRSSILLAWSFNTQTIASPLDEAAAGSPASQLTSATAPDTLTIAQTIPPAEVEAFYSARLGAGSCASLGCAAIGTIYIGAFVSPNFQSGIDCHTPAAPGPWSDPVHPVKVCDQIISVIAVVPANPAGASGYKTVIFGHGLGRSKGDLLAFAGRLAAQGIASIAMDAVLSGDRAFRTSSDAAIGCAAAGMGNTCTTAIDATCAAQCFDPILSTNLATTRDNLRQTVLDTMKLQRVLAACAAPGACQSLVVDAAHIGYVGQSLGSLLGETTVAQSKAIKTAVFSVGGADWVQIFTFTANPQIRCSIIDSLIDAGVLQGAKSNLGTNPAALCLDPAAPWRSNPAFVSFGAVARWILDPIDAINFTRAYRMGGDQLFLQEVKGDLVVPNEATDPYGSLLGLMKVPASVATSAMPTATPAAGMAGSSWVEYKNIPADPAQMFPGNNYAHGSLLSPATPDPAGLLGTAQMQTDALTYLGTHL